MPKVESLAEVDGLAGLLAHCCVNLGLATPPRIHVMIESPAGLRLVDAIAGHPSVDCLSFGLMDFVSAHRGAIDATALSAAGQFENPLVYRAKLEISAACHAHDRVASHSVVREIDDGYAMREVAQKARQLGYRRQWSIHPDQIAPTVETFSPSSADVDLAVEVLQMAAANDWGPIRWQNHLHDRASYRYYFGVLVDAQRFGQSVGTEAKALLTHQ